MSDYHIVMADVEFQNRFGMHTRPFQELAAYILIMAREHTDLSVREVGAYVKNLMEKKHKLELDLAEEKNNATTAVTEMDRLRRDNDTLAACLARDQGALRSLGFVLGDGGWKLPAHISFNQTETIRRLKAELEETKAERNNLSNDHNEIGKLRAIKERFYAVMKELLRESSLSDVEADAYVEGRCDPVMRAHAIKNDAAVSTTPQHSLCLAAIAEATRARGLFPKADHLTLALAEEAGEITKAVLDFHNGKGGMADVQKEIVQTMAMCLRLATEGDPTLNLPATV